MFRTIAIRKVHPEVTTVNTTVDGSNVARDKDWNLIELDETKIDEEETKLQADYDSKQYQRDRATAYPSIQEQLDMQYWDAVNETTTWKDAVAKVKTDNPKPS